MSREKELLLNDSEKELVQLLEKYENKIQIFDNFIKPLANIFNKINRKLKEKDQTNNPFNSSTIIILERFKNEKHQKTEIPQIINKSERKENNKRDLYPVNLYIKQSIYDLRNKIIIQQNNDGTTTEIEIKTPEEFCKHHDNFVADLSIIINEEELSFQEKENLISKKRFYDEYLTSFILKAINNSDYDSIEHMILNLSLANDTKIDRNGNEIVDELYCYGDKKSHNLLNINMETIFNMMINLYKKADENNRTFLCEIANDIYQCSLFSETEEYYNKFYDSRAINIPPKVTKTQQVEKAHSSKFSRE